MINLLPMNGLMLRQLSCCGLSLLVIPLFGAAPTYSVQDLGIMTDLADRSDSQPNGINASGAVAASNVSNGAYRAFVHDGQWRNLGTLGGQESLGADVNDQGMVVGTSLTTGGLSRAFLWTSGGTDGVPGNPQMKDLGTPGGTHSEAYSINASGQISGFVQANLEDHAFVWTAGTMQDIGALLGGPLIHSYGLAINDAGHVAGLAFSSGFAVTYAFYYNGTTAVDIGTLGGVGASALAINNTDRIAGYAATAEGFDHAFLYANGTMTDLGTLGGGYSYGVALNDGNVVVGGSFTDPANTVYHAFVYVDGVMLDLNERLDNSGLGWTLVEARAINDKGQIAGIGRLGGVKRGFLLTPLSTVPSPLITGLEFEGNDVLVSFASTASTEYAIEARSDFQEGEWGTAMTDIAGTGGTVTVPLVGAAGAPGEFYRVRVSGP